MTQRRRGPWSLATVRTRTTAVAVVVVGIALVVGGVVLVQALRDSLRDSVRTSARLRAEDISEAIEHGTDPAMIRVEREEDLVVQVLDERGRVMSASPNAPRRPLLPSARAGRTETLGGLRLGNEGPEDFLVYTDGARGGGRRYRVLVGRSLDSVDDAIDLETRLMLVGIPVLLVVTGATAWWLAGRALAPVEVMRAEVAAISADELHRRVPPPPGDDEVARLARTMNAMLERLDESRARQQRFVSDASHELRSPVATIRQHAEVARSHPSDTTVEELAMTVLAEDQRLERLVDDLLWLARDDERGARPAPTAVDLDDLVLEEAARLRASSRARIDTAQVSGGQVQGDREQLRHMLRNLGDNSARHARTTVAFTLAERDGHVVLRVDDDGPGIPPDARTRVFERFARLDNARSRDAGGTGLGLAIVAEIVAAHGGTVEALGAPLGGARLEVLLPAAP